MRPVTVTVGNLAAANAALLAASQTPVSGTPLTLTGTQPDQARRVLLTFGNEAAARTLVLVGTNGTGNPISETLSVPSGAAGTVYTIQDFATLLSATPGGGGWTAAATLGTNTIASSPWKLTNAVSMSPLELSFGGIVSGAVNWGIEYTYVELNANAYAIGSQALGNYPPLPVAYDHPTLQNLDANGEGVLNDPIMGWRVKVNSGTGSVAVTAIEAGIAFSHLR